MHLRRTLALGFVVGSLLVATAACSNSSDNGGGNGGQSPGGGSKGSVTISGQNFGEMQIMAAMYQQVLEHAGYSVTVKLVDTRDVYVPQLKSGAVDLVPDYLGGMADYLQALVNGADAPPLTSNDPQKMLSDLKPLATKYGITMLQPAKATDQNAFAVTKQYAEQNNLTTLSDLGALGKPVVLAAAPDCQGRSDCQAGLANTYGIDITKILKLGFDTTQTKDSVTKGESQLGEVATTDGALDQEGLVILQDNLGIQPAQNLIPAANPAFIKAHPDVATLLNKLSATLTTSDLAALDLKLAVNREPASQIAQEYLSSKGLV